MGGCFMESGYEETQLSTLNRGFIKFEAFPLFKEYVLVQIK